MKPSGRFTVNKEDLQRVLKNALIFTAPALLVLLADVAKALPGWFNGVWLIVAVYVVNIVTDFIRKFVSGK